MNIWEQYKSDIEHPPAGTDAETWRRYQVEWLRFECARRNPDYRADREAWRRDQIEKEDFVRFNMEYLRLFYKWEVRLYNPDASYPAPTNESTPPGTIQQIYPFSYDSLEKQSFLGLQGYRPSKMDMPDIVKAIYETDSNSFTFQRRETAITESNEGDGIQREVTWDEYEWDVIAIDRRAGREKIREAFEKYLKDVPIKKSKRDIEEKVLFLLAFDMFTPWPLEGKKYKHWEIGEKLAEYKSWPFHYTPEQLSKDNVKKARQLLAGGYKEIF